MIDYVCFAGTLEVRKTPFLRHFILKATIFTKTGSG
jgi:hypothetical protein